MSKGLYSPYHLLIPERAQILHELAQFKSQLFVKTEVAKRTFFLQAIVINPNAEQTILITAGCHGNEPAPVYGILEWLRKGRFPKKRVVIVPCISPYGFCTHIDRNEQGVNINRDFYSKKPQKETAVLKQLVKKYTPSIVLNLHEDPDEEKFYVYSDRASKLAQHILTVAKLPFYRRKTIHGDTVVDGIVTGGIANGSFEDYLTSEGIPNLCIETPGILPFQRRVAAYEEILSKCV